jgi:hypothetical protein
VLGHGRSGLGPTKEGLAEKKKNARFRGVYLKLLLIKAAFLFRLNRGFREPNLRLKPETIHVGKLVSIPFKTTGLPTGFSLAEKRSRREN